MSEEFLERLRKNRLTNIEEYQRMKEALAEMKSEDEGQADSPSDEWKSWQLLPASAGLEEKKQLNLIDPLSNSARSVHRAISILDKDAS